ncbi:4-hydroxy-3-polyprenylbenzoate decarboxylase [Oceanospirillum multiglobuliferum]|uniref:Flavin prenyltransferase UbiX n=1 Tax=Oceanospirillum multiglobuliferum TaxID=64969 RepID=A0A1T4N4C7_9GAMM|nr:flavin prenyltransferase UbiX [Oceanospirillum multiglobuliferum]OPX55830.1 aromatic acid decarboxylase [Oceanospirillum multiglobuliferum]SJZ73961.1 4-hydroxy-3-polyprenylbenzoate decarboxylase [Oceanospirillum multiglobuliferum]
MSRTPSLDVKRERVTVALTGASGVQYGIRLIECLITLGCEVSVLVSKAAQVVIATETEEKWPSDSQRLQEVLCQRFNASSEQIKVYGRENWMSPVASGSGAPHKMVICPCSTGTLSAIATAASNNLIERAADVALKERRQLILVHREAPYHEVHLQHMLTLTRMGALVMPASPGFYHNPKTVNDMVDFIVARILDQLGFDQSLMPRWGEAV